MTNVLPDWYPLANATNEEVEIWLSASTPPYEEMRVALPWLSDGGQFDSWLDGVREGLERIVDPAAFRRTFPGIADLPLPPRRSPAREVR